MGSTAMPRLLFIDAVDYENHRTNFLPTLGLGYLASSLRKEFGYNHTKVKIVRQDIEQAIHEFRPDIIGITSLTKNYNRAIRYAAIAKQHGLPVIIGGMHISALPSTLTSDMDLGVIGEGERTIVDLVKLFCDKGNFDRNELENIDGVAFRRDDKVIVTKERKLIEPLDDIPMPARDLFAIDGRVHMITSRGCPYRCAYCTSSRFWGKGRYFSEEYVVDEVEHLLERYKVKRIEFWDDLFAVSKARVGKIADLLEKKGILGKVSFFVEARSSQIDRELAQLFRRMNVTNVSMGLESGCPSTLEYLKGKGITINDHINAINILRDHGIEPEGAFIIGSPKETRGDILQTLEFIKEMRLTTFSVHPLTPFPGAPVWEYAKARDLVADDMDWDVLDASFSSSKDRAVTLSEVLSKDEIHELFLMFQKEQLKGLSRILIRMALRNPFKIPGLLLWAFRERASGGT